MVGGLPEATEVELGDGLSLRALDGRKMLSCGLLKFYPGETPPKPPMVTIEAGGELLLMGKSTAREFAAKLMGLAGWQ